MITIFTGVSSTLVSALEIAKPSMSKVRSLIAGDRSFSATRPDSRQASTSAGTWAWTGRTITAHAAKTDRGPYRINHSPLNTSLLHEVLADKPMAPWQN